jgi:hypothetical protein
MPTTSPDGTNSSHRLAILSQQEVDKYAHDRYQPLT